jgi:hypothetical protein
MVAAPPVPALASRFQLLGVAAGERSGGGAAVISVDGKPARPYRVGSIIDEGLVLQSVRGRQAVIAASDGKPLLTLELPAPRSDGIRPAPLPVPVPQGLAAPQALQMPALQPRVPGMPVPAPAPLATDDGAPPQAPITAPR